MLIVAVLIYFLPTIVALARGHLSTLAIFFLDLFLGWTLIGWIVALIWAGAGNTAANLRRAQAAYASPVQRAPAPPRRDSLWIVLILILLAIIALDKGRDFRDVRSFDLTLPSRDSLHL